MTLKEILLYTVTFRSLSKLKIIQIIASGLQKLSLTIFINIGKILKIHV